MFDKVRQLCADPDCEVRKIMANEVLMNICKNINTEMIEIFILEKVLLSQICQSACLAG